MDKYINPVVSTKIEELFTDLQYIQKQMSLEIDCFKQCLKNKDQQTILTRILSMSAYCNQMNSIASKLTALQSVSHIGEPEEPAKTIEWDKLIEGLEAPEPNGSASTSLDPTFLASLAEGE